jgi:hypothetical protein
MVSDGMLWFPFLDPIPRGEPFGGKPLMKTTSKIVLFFPIYSSLPRKNLPVF